MDGVSTAITFPCAHCHATIVAAPADLRLVEHGGVVSTYLYDCPCCDYRCEVGVHPAVITMFRQARVRVIPAEAAEVHNEKTLTYDDLIDFHDEMKNFDGVLPQ